MPPPATDSVVTLSVLDRLIDLDPRNSKEVAPTRLQSVRMHRDAVRRDLEWLLNTRRVAVPVDESLKELCRSVYNFGLPDFTGYSMATPDDKTRLIKQLQNALKIFETRIARVRIIPLDSQGSEKIRTLRFRIEGLLLMVPEPEHVTFDAELQLTSGTYRVDNAG
jgi:type VI secretion system protein ImpF